VRGPIFVVGSPRSGTSLLAYAIKTVGGYAGYSEGQVFSLIAPLMKAIREHYESVASVSQNPKHMVSKFPQAAAQEMVLRGFRDLASMEFGGTDWIDKTPGAQMIQSAPFLRRIWPESFFVFAQRRGIENVLSRQQKFPHHAFEVNCELWATNMEAWLAVSDHLDGCHFSVDQIDLEEQPDQVAEALADSLMFDGGQAERVAEIFKTLRPEDSGGRARSRSTLSNCGWSLAERKTFMHICGAVSEAFGYTTDQSYRTKSSDLRLSVPESCRNGSEGR
jgi:hypothetical protein